MDARTLHTLSIIRRLLWCSLAVWALVAVTPLFMILRELVGPGREAFNIGMAPATSAKDAWAALTSAKTYDRSLGGNYTPEIDKQMGKVAPKAAVAFMIQKDYTKAKQAVVLAESTNPGNDTTQGVRVSLEQRAGDLYKEAQALQSSDTAAATQKYREIQRMVDSKSPWHQKAGKALTAIKSG